MSRARFDRDATGSERTFLRAQRAKLTLRLVKRRRAIDEWFIADVLPHAAQFRAYARRLTASADEAEDLVQEAYVRVLATDDFLKIQSGRSFVLRVLHNLAINRARRARIVAIEHIPDVEALGRADPAPDPQARAAARQELARLEAAMRALPDQCRRVVALRKIYEMSPTEIAAQLKISVSTVEKHLTKGMRLVAEALAWAPAPDAATERNEWARPTKTDGRN
jgi:RNA polymerase sigma-70 factor (ECF subfamily)